MISNKKISHYISLLAGAVSLAACELTPNQLQSVGVATLAPQASTKEVVANLCTTASDKSKSNLKYIFIVDRSGSNYADAEMNIDAGTDPTGENRFGSLQTYIDQKEAERISSGLPPDPSVFYSLLLFSTNASTRMSFTNNLGSFKNVIDEQINQRPSNSYDDGFTHYINAINAATAMIKNDIDYGAKLAPEIVSTFYVVIFITDGLPVYGFDPNTFEPLEFQPGDVLPVVASLKALEYNKDYSAYIDSIQLHTGFYYNDSLPSADRDRAISLLTQMAETGSGTASSFSDGQKIDYGVFNLPERNVRKVLRDVFVVNQKVGWHNGQLYPSSAGDGIPDIVKERLGANPSSKDSDGNGLSDKVEMMLYSGRPCKSNTCAPMPFANSTAVCDSFADRDNDGLNDCEEKFLKSNPEDFDHNKNWVPDGLQVHFGINPTGPANDIFSIPNQDGESLYLKMKYGIPVNFPSNKIRDLSRQKYSLNITSEDSTKTCFRLKVEDVYTLSPDDVISLHLLENNAVIDSKRFYRSGQKAFGSGSTLIFRESDLDN